MRVPFVPLALVLLAGALAACDSSPSDSSPLAREDVGGVYHICTLAFTPAGIPPQVNVLAAVAQTDPPQDLPRPALRLSLQTDAFELEYTPKNDVVRKLVQGTYDLGTGTVTLDFPTSANVGAILLPSPLTLDYEPGVLSATSAGYTVAREDYAALAGLSAEEARNLSSRIEGVLTARFTIAPC